MPGRVTTVLRHLTRVTMIHDFYCSDIDYQNVVDNWRYTYESNPTHLTDAQQRGIPCAIAIFTAAGVTRSDIGRIEISRGITT